MIIFYPKPRQTAGLLLILTASLWMFFGAFLPLVIVGYIVYPKLKYFT